jgi:hypothetical protein
MEKLLDTGKVRAIGVSNFGIPLLSSLVSKAKVVPVTNQVELHPCLPLIPLRKLCAEHGIVVTAYSPLGRPQPGKAAPPFLADEGVKAIAQRLGATEAQVALSWAVQQGIIVVPKSENPERMKANLHVRPFPPRYLLYFVLIRLTHISLCILIKLTLTLLTQFISERGCTVVCSVITSRTAPFSDGHTRRWGGTW